MFILFFYTSLHFAESFQPTKLKQIMAIRDSAPNKH